MKNNQAGINKNFLLYQPLLERTFVVYLTDNGASEKTKANYRTDLRHFLLWMQATIRDGTPVPAESHLGFLSIISSELLANYRRYLLDHNIPVRTINRRMSSLRSFLKCCKIQGWINSNAQIEITNIQKDQKTKDSTTDTWFDHLALWGKQLEQQGASKSTIKNYTNDVESFLRWFHEKK